MNTSNTIGNKNVAAEEKFTVAKLRQNGFRVDIVHLRRVKGTKGVLAQKHNVDHPDMLEPKGGATEARIMSPLGKRAVGVVKVFHKDAYCRKEGIHQSLKRALENLDG